MDVPFRHQIGGETDRIDKETAAEPIAAFGRKDCGKPALSGRK
jgi:hypothetical protein